MNTPLPKQRRLLALKVVLVVVGLFFLAAAMPMIDGVRDPANSDTGDTMQMAFYVVLGAFLLVAARDPARNRSLLAFAAWSQVAHGVVMTSLGFEIPDHRTGFIGASILLVVIAVVLLVLLPAKSPPTGP